MKFGDKKSRKPFLKQVNITSVSALSIDGEIYTAEKKVQIVQEDDQSFRMIYNEFMAFLNGADSLVEVKVFNWIQGKLPYNDTEIVLNKKNKIAISEHTGMSYSAIEKAIGSLVDKEVLVRDNNYPRAGIYNVNPSYVWYGDTTKRKGALKFTLEMIQHQNLPDLEQRVQEDIKRYEKWYNDKNR